jgi:uncharacterized protein DUF6353
VLLFTEFKEKAAVFVQENATTLLTAGGVVGVVGTAVLTAKAAFSAATALEAEQIIKSSQSMTATELINQDPMTALPKLDKLTTLKIAGPYFIPPVLSGTATITAIIFSHRMSAQKAAALAAAYGLAERNLTEYREKVQEKLTGPKQKAVEAELAQDAVNKTPGGDKLVFVEGEVLCFDKPGGRYFTSTMERIRQAVNTTNAEVLTHGYASLNFFYQEIGLDSTTWSGEVGFNPENLLDLSFDTVFAPGNRPCIVFDFRHMPEADFRPNS